MKIQTTSQEENALSFFVSSYFKGVTLVSHFPSMFLTLLMDKKQIPKIHGKQNLKKRSQILGFLFSFFCEFTV